MLKKNQNWIGCGLGLWRVALLWRGIEPQLLDSPLEALARQARHKRHRWKCSMLEGKVVDNLSQRLHVVQCRYRGGDNVTAMRANLEAFQALPYIFQPNRAGVLL